MWTGYSLNLSAPFPTFFCCAIDLPIWYTTGEQTFFDRTVGYSFSEVLDFGRRKLFTRVHKVSYSLAQLRRCKPRA